jgi:acyl carrier protein
MKKITTSDYNKIFSQNLLVEESSLENLKYQDVPEWDSVGHMNLMGSLEEEFKIEMDIDDIIDFSSYKKGKEILSKYNIEFSDE